MTKEFFKEFCKHIKSEILLGIPDGESLRVSRDKEFYCIECDGFKYTHYSSGNEYIQAREGLDDED